MTAANGIGLRQAVRWGAVLLLGVGYSVIAHWSAASPERDTVGALVAITPFLALALVMAWRSPRRALMLAAWVASCAALFGTRDWLVMHYNWVFLLQHAGIYALLCAAFGRTLQAGRVPMVTGFARIVHRSLSPALVAYTHALTWAWTLYFGFVTALSLLLFWLAPVVVWSAFANLVSPLLLVLVFVVEYGVRCHVLPPADRAGPLEAIRAYRRSSSDSAAHQP